MSAAYWIFVIAFDGLFAALLYFWQIQGNQASGVFFIGAMWFISVLGLLAVARPDTTIRTIVFQVYSAATDVALILAIVYIGHVWLAATYTLACVSMRVFRLAAERAP